MTLPFSEEQLNNFRQQGDPLADDVIQIFANQYGASIQELIINLENIIRLESKDKIIDSIATSFPDNKIIQEALEHYFTQAVTIPTWVDTEKVKLGSHVFQDHVFSSIMILGCASLPTTYICQPDTKVLGFTRLLINNAPKRLVETAQMVSDVMSDGGIKIEGRELTGKGIQSILKIRLIHACVRYLMLNKETLCKHHHPNSNSSLLAYVFDEHQEKCEWSGKQKPELWNISADGIPINQEALSFILLTFSYTILRGLKQIGVKINARQREAYLHSWNVVGYVLGVNEIFLKEFTTYENSAKFHQQIMLRRRGESMDGKLLEQALLEAFSVNVKKSIPLYLGYLIPANYLAKLTTSLIMEKKSYNALGIRLGILDQIARACIWIFIRFFGSLVNLGYLRWLSDIVFKSVAATLWSWRKHHPDTIVEKRKHLYLPEDLVKTSYLSGKYKE